MLTADERDPGRRPGPGDVPADGGTDPDGSDAGHADGGQAELDRVLRTIGRRAQRANLSRASQLATALSRAESGDLDAVSCNEAVELAHQLVGSAGTFGFDGASQLAAELEAFFGAGVFDEPRLQSARRQLEVLNDQLNGDPTD